ncbi:MAG TPA: dienelactone hydrolase family protein [Planctomycetota bacterium]|nr:dienelactone hydrolase family protein [Planctomycetota bacterium]
MSKTLAETEEVALQSGKATLQASLTIPDNAAGLVIFVHGSGSSRFSPRNRSVAAKLNDGALATLLLDLLTMPEQRADEHTGHLRFNIPFLAGRVAGALDWSAAEERTRALPIGLFGASTGAAAALIAAAERPEVVRAVVSRGGRPDLAPEALPLVKAPVLLIIGGDDSPVIEMNRQAAQLLNTEHRIEIVPGATHLFEEPGTLDQVAQLARDWFRKHLRSEE